MKRSLCFAVVGLATMMSSGVLAWGVNAYYPTAITPVMPSSSEAVQLKTQQPFLLRSLRHAHRENNRRGWISVPSVESADRES